MRGGECLSIEYNDPRVKMRWRCREGHEWEALAGSVIGGSWCPKCRGGDRESHLEQMRALAAVRGGQCLSPVFVNARTKLLWRCAQGHEWEALGWSVRSGSWCPVCFKSNRELAARDVGSLRQMAMAIAEEKNGACLPARRDDRPGIARLLCRAGHQWTMPLRSVIRGKWCKECVADLARVSRTRVAAPGDKLPPPRHGDSNRQRIENLERLADGTRTASEIAAQLGGTARAVTVAVTRMSKKGKSVSLRPDVLPGTVAEQVLPLADGSRSVKTIAEFLGLNRSAVSVAIGRMRALGLPVSVLKLKGMR